MILVQEWCGDAFVVLGVFDGPDAFVKAYMLQSEGYGGDNMAAGMLVYTDADAPFNHYIMMEDGGQEFAVQFMITEIGINEMINRNPLDNYVFKPEDRIFT